MSLREKLSDPRHFIALYGTTAPRADAPPERVAKAADRLMARVGELPLDGLVVYDVQDESARTPEPRPFPFLPTLDSRVYAKLLYERSDRPVITYKSIGGMNAQNWEQWLSETQTDYGVNYLSLVGVSSSRAEGGSLSLSDATRMAANHPAAFTLGGVVIAERHGALSHGVVQSETTRLVYKAQNGCRFFISQCIYHAETTIRLLRDYAQLCREQEIAPTRIVLTFIPCGRPKTLEFIEWLGISVAPETRAAILDAPQPIQKSIEICCDNLRAILEQDVAQELPLGVNVESVSINKDEIDGSIELFHALHEVAQSVRPQRV